MHAHAVSYNIYIYMKLHMQIEGGETARPTRDKIMTKACDHVPAYLCLFSARHPIVEPRKLEHGFRRISARIPYILP